MASLKPILILTTVIVVLTFGLFGFTIATIGLSPEIEIIENGIGCGTTAIMRENGMLPVLSAEAQIGEALFKTNCKTCHRMEQKLIGPALLGVFDRTDSVWVRRWITNPALMIKQGDPYAVALFNEYNKAQMTAFTTLSKAEMDALLTYLKEAGNP